MDSEIGGFALSREVISSKVKPMKIFLLITVTLLCTLRALAPPGKLHARKHARHCRQTLVAKHGAK